MDIVARLVKERKEREKVFSEYVAYASRVKQAAARFLKSYEVYVFGSVVKGDYHVMLSDIDIAVVTDEPVDTATLKAAIEDELRIPGLFQIHVVTRRTWRNWYLKFIDSFVEV